MVSKVPVVGSVYNGISEASKLNQQDTPLIDDLNGALDALGEAFEQGDHSIIRNEAANVVLTLKQIFVSPNGENFKNVGSITSWASYFKPLITLLGLLETYLRPGLALQQPTISSLQQALKPAQDLIKGESAYQQGAVAGAVSTACNQLGREVKKTARGFTGSSAPVEAEIRQHPLTQVKQLIGTYLTHGADYLPVSRENHLSAALRHLDQKSSVFKNVEAFVYGKIDEGKLHENHRA